MYACVGFVTADDLAVANLLTDLFRFAEHGFTCPLDDRHRSAFAQRWIEYLAFDINSAYAKIVVKFSYSQPSGTVWFDAPSLIK